MFDIEYKGGNGLLITTKKSSVAIDPKLSVVGLKDVVTKGMIEIATEPRFATNNSEARILIEGPGEYEIGDCSIRGIAAIRHLDTDKDERLATVYRIEIGDVRLAILGNITSKLSEQQLEDLGIVDIVVLPIGGGGYTLDATSAASIVRQIDPKVVIPTSYADDDLKYEVPQDTLETFTKELGAPVEAVAKYKVKSSATVAPVLTVVAIARS